MVKPILVYPQDKEILLQESVEIDPTSEEAKLISQDLIDTLMNTKNGVGISAIQIGEPVKICVINYGMKQPLVMINPKITWKRSGTSGQKKFVEGCLSAPNTYTEVLRPQKVICEYYDLNGQLQQIGQGGWISAIIQHELDHFTGHCEVFDAVKEA